MVSLKSLDFTSDFFLRGCKLFADRESILNIFVNLVTKTAWRRIRMQYIFEEWMNIFVGHW